MAWRRRARLPCSLFLLLRATPQAPLLPSCLRGPRTGHVAFKCGERLSEITGPPPTAGTRIYLHLFSLWGSGADLALGRGVSKGPED